MSTYVLGENALRKLKAVFNATTIGVEDGPEARRLDDQDFVPAWTIKWASSLNSWIVWIPPSSAVDSAGVDIAALAVSEMTAAGGNYPTGWYMLGLSAGTSWTTVYLNISEDAASFGTSAATGTTSIPIARIKGTDDPFMRDVMQLQVGELVIGGGSADPDNKSTDNNADAKLEVYGWKTQASESQTLAQRLDATSSGSVDIVVRDGGTNGTLKYVPIGSFQSGGSGESTQPTVEIVGDVMYDMSDHQLKKRIDTVNLRTGAVVQGNWVMIVGGQATPHSGE